MSHIAIVIADFYEDIARELLLGARALLESRNHSWEVVKVPGAFEIPAAVRFASESQKFDGFVALGCVIRGETTHYDYVCLESARGLQDLAIRDGLCIGYGILTTEDKAQAMVRASVDNGNKGRDATEACLRMIELKQHFTG